MEPKIPPSTALATVVTFRPFAFASTTSVFILLGAMTSLFGPLLESFAHRFDLSLADAGFTLSVYFVGATLGILPGWLGLKHLQGRVVLTLSSVLIAFGAAGASLSHLWILFLISVFLIGLGSGALDIGLNTLLARTALKGRAHRLSIGNAGYGVGAVICPLAIIALGPHNFPMLFGGLGVLALLLSTMNRGVNAAPLRAEPRPFGTTMMKGQRRLILATFIVACTVYAAVEASSSGWMATELYRVGYSESAGTLVTAGFWTGLAVGRSVSGPLYHWLSDRKLILAGLALAVVVCLLAVINPLAPYAFPLLGLIIAPVFPMSVIWYTTLCPNDSNGLGILILFMMIGGAAGPAVLSFLVLHFDVHVVPFALTIFALLDSAVFFSALRFRPIAVTSGSLCAEL